MAWMPRVVRLLAVCTWAVVVAGSAARGADGVGAPSDSPLPPWPSNAAPYQPPSAARMADNNVTPAMATEGNGQVQPTAYVAGPAGSTGAARATTSAPTSLASAPPSVAPSVPPAPPAPAPTTTPAHAKPDKSTPLPPPSRRVDPAQSQASGQPGAARPGGLSSFFTLLGGLGVVIALFLAAAWALRRTTGGHVPTLPREVVEVLGRVPLAGRQQVHLLRVGRKLILVAVSQAGMETLTEVTDAPEVDRLAGLCQQARPDSATTVFRNVLERVVTPSTERPRPTVDELRLANLKVPQFIDEFQESRHA